MTQSMAGDRTMEPREAPISVWGLGKLGLPVAAVFAERVGAVIGVDVDSELVDTVARGNCPMTHEPGLDDLVEWAVERDRLQATDDGVAAATAASLHVVVVPTLLTDGGDPDLSAVRAALETIASGLDPGDLILVESTLPPGTTRSLVRPLLAAESGLDPDVFGVAYCPERTSSGTALRDIRGQYPRVIGGVDENSARAAADVYETLTSNAVTVVSDARTAELVKLFEGIYRDVNIALANEFLRSMGLTDVSVREAIAAANALPMCDIHDPGPGVGGHCIPVYPQFLLQTADGECPVVETARSVNEGMPRYTVDTLERILSHEARSLSETTVAVLGLTYRPNIPETRFSPGLDIMIELERSGATAVGIDPLVEAGSVACRVEPLEYLQTGEVDAAIVSTPHDAVHAFDWSSVEPLVILDARAALDIETERHRVYSMGGER